MRLLYSGPSDDTAFVKRVEDEDIDAALANGWRVRRVIDTPTEIEPTSDRNPDPAIADGESRPEDSEPDTSRPAKGGKKR